MAEKGAKVLQPEDGPSSFLAAASKGNIKIVLVEDLSSVPFVSSTERKVSSMPFASCADHKVSSVPFVSSAEHKVSSVPFVSSPQHKVSSVPFVSSPRHKVSSMSSEDLGLADLEQLDIHPDPSYVAKFPDDDKPIRMPSNVRTLKEWGSSMICYGTTHNGKRFQEVYDKFPDYRRWIKSHAQGDEQEAFRQYVLARERIDKQEGQLPITPKTAVLALSSLNSVSSLAPLASAQSSLAPLASAQSSAVGNLSCCQG